MDNELARKYAIDIIISNVALAGFESEGKPIFNREKIVFCGTKGLNCETFVIKTVETPRRLGRPVLSYCKTEKLSSAT